MYYQYVMSHISLGGAILAILCRRWTGVLPPLCGLGASWLRSISNQIATLYRPVGLKMQNVSAARAYGAVKHGKRGFSRKG